MIKIRLHGTPEEIVKTKKWLKNQEYDKIIAGVYDDDSNKKEKQNINVSSKKLVHERSYSPEELEGLFTDLDSIKFD